MTTRVQDYAQPHRKVHKAVIICCPTMRGPCFLSSAIVFRIVAVLPKKVIFAKLGFSKCGCLEYHGNNLTKTLPSHSVVTSTLDTTGTSILVHAIHQSTYNSWSRTTTPVQPCLTSRRQDAPSTIHLSSIQVSHSRSPKPHDLTSSALCFGLSTISPSFGNLATPPPFASALPFALSEVESFGSSLTYGRNSGCPGIYFLRTCGTSMPSSFW